MNREQIEASARDAERLDVLDSLDTDALAMVMGRALDGDSLRYLADIEIERRARAATPVNVANSVSNANACDCDGVGMCSDHIADMLDKHPPRMTRPPERETMTNERLAALREAAMQDDLVLADSIELIQEVDRLLAALDALTAEHEASARDAERLDFIERYRWSVRPDGMDGWQARGPRIDLGMRMGHLLHGAHRLREVIDAARAATPSEGTP